MGARFSDAVSPVVHHSEPNCLDNDLLREVLEVTVCQFGKVLLARLGGITDQMEFIVLSQRRAINTIRPIIFCRR